MNLRLLLVLICFLLSGFSGLIYQTAWALEFALVFGTTELALVTVLAGYMAGLTLGAAAGGKFAYRLKRPLRAYAVLELGIGLAALAIPFAIQITGKLQTTLFGGYELPASANSSSSILFYAISSFLILLVPTTLMGATLPLLARWAVTRDSEIGPRMALLYTTNVAGAAAGTLTAAFILLPALGLGNTVRFAVGINLLIFLLAATLPHSLPLPLSESESKSASKMSHQSWILPIMLVSGIVSFSWEVIWTRLLTHLLGGSVYAFAIMLATFLTGIALGSILVARWTTSRGHATRAMLWAQVAIGVCSLAAFLAVDGVEPLIPLIHEQGFMFRGAMWSAILLLPGTIAMGATFPLGVRILARDAQQTAHVGGRVFAWNTTGAILGAFVTGYLLLPELRFAGAATAMVALSFCLALVIASKLKRRFVSLMLVLAIVFLGLVQLTTPWRVLQHSPMGRGFQGSPDRIAYYGVGRSGTVLLTEEPSSLRLTTNGLPESSIGRPWDLPGRFVIARWLSLLPLLAQPDLQNELIIGLGAGITASDLPESIKDIHVIEIESEVVRANQTIADRRVHPLKDPRLTLHLNDARGALRLTERRFDAIVSQPSHPWTSSSSNLFTQEFFDNVKDHLEPDGVFVAWMGLAFIDADLLQTFVATATAVFPFVELYQPKPNAVILMASQTAWNVNENAQAALETAQSQWAEVGVLVPEDVLAARVLTSEGGRAFAGETLPNTDYHNRFRHRSPKVMANPLNDVKTTRLLAPFASMEARDFSEKPLYFTRRFLRQGQIGRAAAFQQSLPLGAHRSTGQALIHMARGQQKKASLLLHQALKSNPEFDEARAAMLQLWKEPIEQGQPVAPGLQPLTDLETALVEGWRLSSAGDWPGLANLVVQFRGLEVTHPFYFETRRLEAMGLTKSGDPNLAKKGMDLIIPFLFPNPQPADLLLHAEAALNAGFPKKALTSLDLSITLTMYQKDRNQNLQLAQRLLEKVPNEKSVSLWRENLSARINKVPNF